MTATEKDFYKYIATLPKAQQHNVECSAYQNTFCDGATGNWDDAVRCAKMLADCYDDFYAE